VKFLVRVGLRDVLEELQELLVPVPGLGLRLRGRPE
jgi:hypothetical protein